MGMGGGGPGGYRHNNNQRNNQNHYNNHGNYNNHNRYNKHNNNQYNNSPHPHNYNNNNANIKQLPPRFIQQQDLSGKNFKNFNSQNSPVAKQTNSMQSNQMQSQQSIPSQLPFQVSFIISGGQWIVDTGQGAKNLTKTKFLFPTHFNSV